MAAEAWAKIYQTEFDVICPELTPAQMVVYVALVTCRNGKTGKTAPIGIDLLVKKTALKRRTIFDALKVLLDREFLAKEKVGRKAVYSFPYLSEKCIEPHRNSAESRTQNRSIEQRRRTH